MEPNQKNDAFQERIQFLESENQRLRFQISEINQAKELYLKIFEDFPAMIWRSGLDMKCDYFNKAWLTFRGKTLEQEMDNGWSDGVHPEDHDACMRIYESAFEKRESYVFEYRMQNKNGDYAWLRDFGTPFYDLDNSFLGYIGSCYDITEIKNNELALLELNTTKDKFLSIISHDLRNPINTVVGLSEILEKNVAKKDYKTVEEYAKYISQSTKRIKKLLLSLLEWSVSQGGRMDYNPSEVSLKSIVTEVIDLTEEMLKQKGIEVEAHFVENDKLIVDKEMISTVIRNFLTNAIKFCYPNGKIVVKCEIKGDSFAVSISDNGVGMSKEILNSLFVMGETISSKGTNNETGTGIGLLLCKEFIEKHQGKILVDSVEGQGSVFQFHIPTIERMNGKESVLN